MTYFLTLEDVTELGIAMLAEEGQEFLIADAGLLGSALMRPQTSVFGEDAYPTLPGKAAALMHSLARNYALVDGNERMAWAATKLFLRFNYVALRAPTPEAGEEFVIDVAMGVLGVAEIANRIQQWAKPVRRAR